jgi:hypothetical protein
MLPFIAISLLAAALAQPPQGEGMNMGGAATVGQSTDTTCTAITGNCMLDGSSNYVVRDLAYDTATGMFSGSIVTNSCPNFQYQLINGMKIDLQTGLEDSSLVTGGASADCVKQTFPAYTAPIAAPTLGAVAYSIHGVQIYGPFENGLQT